MEKIAIDKLSPEDLHGLKLLYEDGFEGSTSDEASMINMFHQIKDNPNYCILRAKKDDSIVGSVTGIICYELFGTCLPFMVVENVAVLKDYRRLGIAKQLMTQLEDHAKLKGCSMIIFVSSEHRTGAHKMYESLGYGLDKVYGYRKRLM